MVGKPDLFVTLIWLSTVTAASTRLLEACLRGGGVTNFTLPRTPSYDQILAYGAHNMRITTQNNHQPVLIILPATATEVQTLVKCCESQSTTIVTRSGGHSYEGLSYTSPAPNYAILDLMRMDSVHVDATSETAWVEAGATVGQLYAAIVDTNDSALAFPAGVCPTVGMGGHVTGGGQGFLTRMHGIAADHVMDALIVDVQGHLLDKSTMGSDLFWAIRGGGGASWGVVVAFKLSLVRVPQRVTILTATRSSTDPTYLASLLDTWQNIATSAPNELFLRVAVTTALEFQGMYVGTLQNLIEIMSVRFPELGLSVSECTEGTWAQSVMWHANVGSVSELRERYYKDKKFFKGKSDVVKDPLPHEAFVGALRFLAEQPSNSYIILSPLRVFMDRVAPSDTPFPYRKGYLYDIQYMVAWKEQGEGMGSMEWIRGFYEYMGRYIQGESPVRAAYVNYVDAEVGREWGRSYFGDNFERLREIKSRVDPSNFFQSLLTIPPLDSTQLERSYSSSASVCFPSWMYTVAIVISTCLLCIVAV